MRRFIVKLVKQIAKCVKMLRRVSLVRKDTSLVITNVFPAWNIAKFAAMKGAADGVKAGTMLKKVNVNCAIR